jgi:hypothetical protein
MIKKSFIILTLISTNIYAVPTNAISSNPFDFIPPGFSVFDKSVGDLNKDKQEDYVFIVKGTDKENIVKDRFDHFVDRNRRGIIIVFKKGQNYELAIKNMDCFSSENEDGGVYFAPELAVGINKGNLNVSYGHGRYGYWSYTFRFQNSNFEMIGYDSSEHSGPVVDKATSINFSTKKMLIKTNTNLNADSGEERFKETWQKITVSQLIKLDDIKDFDELYSDNLLEMSK